MSEAVQAMLFSTDPEADIAFARDVLGIDCAPAGAGWLLFTLPPGQSGLDPTGKDDTHQLYLSCRDLDQATSALAARGVRARDIDDGDGRRAVSIDLPGGGKLSLYEPSCRRP
jgi:hypothetical protein